LWPQVVGTAMPTNRCNMQANLKHNDTCAWTPNSLLLLN